MLYFLITAKAYFENTFRKTTTSDTTFQIISVRSRFISIKGTNYYEIQM